MRIDRSCKHLLSGCSATAALMAFAQPVPGLAQTQPVPAQTQTQTYSFDIPAQDLGSALRDFARASRQQIVFDDKSVRGRRSVALKGTYTVREGLAHLTAGSGVSVETGRSGVFIVRAASQESTSTVPPSTSESVEESAAAQSESAEIVVTGSRLPSEGAAPVTIFDEKKIDELGVTQVADVLRYLPQQPAQSSETTTFGASRSVQLRGLGLGTTLVLINGRRTVTSALQGTRNAFDLNMLPLAAVERIEVLTESASSIYGADAIGGVLNVILKSNIERPTADLYYGTADGGGDEYQASFAFSLPVDRLRNIFVLDYFQRDPLFGRERDLTRNADFRRFGGTDQRVTTGNPGNVCSADFENLPGLPTPCAGVPIGSSGVGLTPADFLPTAGQPNLYSFYSDYTIIPAGKRYSAFTRLEYDLSSAVSAFGELLYVKRNDRHIEAPETISFGFVPETNPFNPFGVPLFVDYQFDLDAVGQPVNRFKSRAWRLVGGLKGQIDKGEWETSILYTHDRGSNFTENGLDDAAVANALAETDPALALNPFQDGPGGSAALLASLRETDPPVDRLKSTALQGSAFLRRELFDLPGGPVEAVVGGEVRNESITIDSRIFDILVKADRDTVSGFFELRAPLIGPDQASPLGHRVSVTASGRFDHYNDFGGTFNPRIGVVWEPTRSLLFRGAYGTSFRAPSLFELYLPATLIPGIVVPDPLRGEFVPIDISISGNPDLDPEEAKSFTAGVLFTPDWAGGVKLGATYWSIDQELRVVRTNPFLVLFNESAFPDLITRAPPTPADIAAGLPGRLLALNAPSINSGQTKTSGIDFEASTAINTAIGRFAPDLKVTWVHSFKSADFPFFPNVERVGLAQASGTIPDVRAVGTLAWSHGGWGASATAQYTSPYDDVDSFGERTGREIDPPILVDMQLSADLGEIAGGRPDWLNGTFIRAGAINLFDADPPFAEVNTGGYGYDISQSDIRGRFLYLKLTKAF